MHNPKLTEHEHHRHNNHQHLQLPRDARKEIALELWRTLAQVMCSKIVVTFDTHAIQVLMFPPTGQHYSVPSGPHTLVVRDGYVEE